MGEVSPFFCKRTSPPKRNVAIIHSDCCCCCCNWEGLSPTWCLGPRHGNRTPKAIPATDAERRLASTCHGRNGSPFYQPPHCTGHRIALLSASPMPNLHDMIWLLTSSCHPAACQAMEQTEPLARLATGQPGQPTNSSNEGASPKERRKLVVPPHRSTATQKVSSCGTNRTAAPQRRAHAASPPIPSQHGNPMTGGSCENLLVHAAHTANHQWTAHAEARQPLMENSW